MAAATMQSIEDRYDDDKPFVDIKLDYGFKWFFGQIKRKHALIRYLNAIFKRAGRDIVVNDVTYHDKEILPDNSKGKRIIYDIYCTSPEGHHFIVEMQNVDEPYFTDRIVYYTTRIIAGQGKAGDRYDVDPIFSIIVTNFNVKGLPKQLFHDIVLYDKETKTVFSDKLNCFIICLPELPKKWKECKTEFERLSFLVNNMGGLDKNSEEYQDMEYQDFMKAAEKSNMSKSEYILYSQSELKEAEYQRGLEWARKQAEAEGRAKGEAEGRAEGEAKGFAKGIVKGKLAGAIEIAKNLLGMNMDVPSVSRACGLEISQVQQIAAQM